MPEDGSLIRLSQEHLAITKTLVHAMGGRIWVESEPERGSTFFFTVHLEDPRDVPAPDPPSSRPTTAETTRSFDVLLAEDDELNALYVTALVEQAGHRVIRAVSGREAVATLRQRKVDLVIMDVQMPELDGVAATAEIRSADGLQVPSDIPIIALTANAMKGDRERFLKAGMTDYLTKPVQPEELQQAILKAVQESTEARGGSTSP